MNCITSSRHTMSELDPVRIGMPSPNFRSDVFPYLQAIYSGLKSKQVISNEKIWNSLSTVIGLLNVNTENIVYCFRLLFEVCRILDEHQCTNIMLKSQVLNLVLKLTNENITEAVMATHRFASTGKDMEYNHKLELPFISNPDLPEDDVIDIVWEAARNSNVGLLKMFLKFGAEMLFPVHEVFSWEKWYRYLEILLWDYDFNFKIADAVILSGSLPFPNRRVLLVKRALEMFYKMKRYSEYAEMYSQCYNLLFESLPDPEVTSKEITTLLQMLLSRMPTENILLLTRGLEELLPRTAQVLQPRSLQHLSRYQVRQNLRKSGDISHAVSSSNIPKLIKKYILLEDDEPCSLIVRKRVRFFGWIKYAVPNSLIDINSEQNDDYVLSVLKDV